MRRDNSAHILISFFVAVVLIVPLLSFVANTFHMKDMKIDNEAVVEFNTGWHYTDGYEQVIVPNLPFTVNGHDQGPITISNVIPEYISDETMLCVETNHQSIMVYIDDELIYEYGETNDVRFGKAFGAAWNLVQIPENSNGRTISLTISSPYNQVRKNLHEVVLGSKSAIVFKLLRENIGSLIFCFVIFVLGTVFVILALVSAVKHLGLNDQSFLYLGLFSIMAAIWTITDTKLPQFVFGNVAVVYMTSFFTFMLMPIPFLLYVKKICRYGNMFLDVLCSLFVLVFLCNTGLYILNVRDLPQTVIFTHILLFLSVISVFSICIREIRDKKNTNANKLFCGMCVFGLCSVFSVLQFYTGNHHDNSRFFRYGFLVFIIMLGISTFKSWIALLRSNTEAKIYKELAYFDVLTGLSNRMAFDRDMDSLECEFDKFKSISLILFDLNHLKKTNDTYGHSSGDMMIKGFGKCISDVFGPLNVQGYRIGGDEFAVILTDRSKNEVTSYVEELENKVEELNNCNDIKVHFAFGCASTTTSGLDFIKAYDLFNTADSKMYSMKMSIGALRED